MGLQQVSKRNGAKHEEAKGKLEIGTTIRVGTAKSKESNSRKDLSVAQYKEPKGRRMI